VVWRAVCLCLLLSLFFSPRPFVKWQPCPPWELMEALSLSRFVLWEGATSLRTNLKRPPDASESTIDGVTNVYSVRVVAMPYGAARGEEKKK